MAVIPVDQFILGQSTIAELVGVGTEIKLDLTLQDNPNINAGGITGIITDLKGNPVASATVKLLDGAGNPIAHVMTGPDGRYSFINLPPRADYHLTAAAPGFLLAQELSISLAAKQQLVINLNLQPDPKVQLSVITGVVLRADTKAKLEGANVALIQTQVGVDVVIQSTTTNATGQFAFLEVAVGDYKVITTMQGFFSSTNLVSVTTPGSIVNAIVESIVNPFTAKGTVNGVIKNAIGLPVPGATVILYREAADGTLMPVAFTRTNASGLYLFTEVNEGKYRVKANTFLQTA